MTPAVEIAKAIEIPEELDRIQGVLRPTGYRLLIRIPHLAAQLKQYANLEMPEETRRMEEQAQLVGQVIDLGPDAYTDRAKFPTGAWCHRGDFVIIRAYGGTRFQMHNAEGQSSTYALINDDSVQGVVSGEVETTVQRIERIR